MIFNIWQNIWTFLDDTTISIMRLVASEFTLHPAKKILMTNEMYSSKDLIIWALTSKNYPKKISLIELVKFNDLNLLRFALTLGYKWNVQVTAKIAEVGYLEMLKFAHKNLFPWNHYTTSNAAKHGNLECLKYAHENGCPWNSFVIVNSIQFDQYECFVYALINECPRPAKLANIAMSYGRIKYIKYLQDNEIDKLKGYYINTENVKRLTVSYIKFLYKQGVKWNMYACPEFAARGELSCLEFARQHGCNWDEKVYLMAAVNNKLDCIEFAYKHHCPLNSRHTYNYILNNGNSECIAFIKEKFGNKFANQDL